MTAVHLSRAEAEVLGVLAGTRPDPKPSRRRPRRTAPGPYRTVCAYCAEVFDTRAGEDRHVDETRHGRYDLILELEVKS
jgi:hypothetical protein